MAIENKTVKGKRIGPAIAAMLGSGFGIFFLGLFQLWAEADESIKKVLLIHEGVGPLSGKVLYGYALGFLVFLVAYAIFRKKQTGKIEPYLYIFIILLLLGSLFTFVPFTDMILGK
jgi:hypothetical protein